jgi:hypothetical protein
LLEEHRVAIDACMDQLENLVPRRNLIVHGITFDISFGSDEVKTYRVGAQRVDVRYLNEFVRQRADVGYSFSARQVQEATIECKTLANKIGPIMSYFIGQMGAAEEIS